MNEKKERIPRRYVNDIAGLTEKYGDLDALRGNTLETSLKELSKICIRDSVKIYGYIGLTNYLKKAYDIELKLYSQKTRKEIL